MRLLVSVATADDARAAVEGGADIVDAKDPAAGALGAVTLARLREIRDAVGGARPVTAALGDAQDEGAIERQACAYADAGATLVKIGLRGVTDARVAEALLAAAVGGAGATAGVVAVAYADADAASALSPWSLIDVAARTGSRGVLIDTMNKNGPGLLELQAIDKLARWTASGREAGLLVAVAGKLQADDVERLAGIGPDVVGVRGAACDGGRQGRVSAERVATLHRLCRPRGNDLVFSY